MGKCKGLQKQQIKKNVFKVATVRSVKLKAKAPKVITNLEKLDLKENKVTKRDENRRAKIDQLFEELHEEVHRCKLKITAITPEQQQKKKMQNASLEQSNIFSRMNEMKIL